MLVRWLEVTECDFSQNASLLDAFDSQNKQLLLLVTNTPTTHSTLNHETFSY